MSVRHSGTCGSYSRFRNLTTIGQTYRLGDAMSWKADNDNKEHAAGLLEVVSRSTTPTGEMEAERTNLGPLRAQTQESLIRCRADLSRLEKALTDLRSQVAQARVA